MSQSGTTNSVSTNPAIPTEFVGDIGFAIPAGNILNVLGGSNISVSGSGNTLTITNTGAGGSGITTLDGNTGSASGVIVNILGATVPAGTSPLSTSAAVSTLTINAQRSQAIAAADSTKVGLSNFDSDYFSVDANGFVSMINNIYISPFIVDSFANPGSNYTTIQSAINAAVLMLPAAGSLGVTIVVRPGYYGENLSIPASRNINIVGITNAYGSSQSVYIDGNITVPNGAGFDASNILVTGTVSIGSANSAYYQSVNFAQVTTAFGAIFHDSIVNGTFTGNASFYNSTVGVSQASGNSTLYNCAGGIALSGSGTFLAYNSFITSLTGSTSGTSSVMANCVIATPGIPSGCNVTVMGLSTSSITTSISPVTTSWKIGQSMVGNVYVARRVAADDTVVRTDYYIGVTGNAAAVNLTLPNTGIGTLKGFNNQVWEFKDEAGTAATKNITLTPNGGTIDGAASYVINANYGSVKVMFNGTNYFIL